MVLLICQTVGPYGKKVAELLVPQLACCSCNVRMKNRSSLPSQLSAINWGKFRYLIHCLAFFANKEDRPVTIGLARTLARL